MFLPRTSSGHLLSSLLLLSAPLACGPSAPASETGEGVDLSARRVVITPGQAGVLVLRGTAATGATVVVEGLPEGVTSSTTEAAGSDTRLRLQVDEATGATEVSLNVRVDAGQAVTGRTVELSIQVPADLIGNEAYAPGVNGEVQTIELEGEPLEVEVIDGLAIADGDLVLGPIDAITDGAELRGITCPNWSTGWTCDRWTDGVIGYNFANDWGDEADNARMRGLIEDAIEHWEENTGLRFVQRASGQWLEFRDGGGCSSTVGRASITGFDSQSIALNDEKCRPGTIIHEIGHAVGIYHEQSRDDRDEWVVVDFGQVRDGKLHNFFQWGGFASDVGEYDYASIMHYRAAAFARNPDRCNATDDSGCTIRPLRPLPAGLGAIGQRDGLSEGDILSAYSLYPPSFSIVGATEGETSDAFTLRVDFETPASASTWPRVTWTSSAVEGVLATGAQLDLDPSVVPTGPQTIVASFLVAGVTVESRSISLDVQNEAPAVTLATADGSLTQPLGLLFTIDATVTDDFDGSCPIGVCTYTWNPEPDFGSTTGSSANFIVDETGPQTITATVTDASGAVGTGSITVDIMNDAPTTTIVSPASDVEIPDGVTLDLEGSAQDVNRPGGALGCGDLSWSSSNPADGFSSIVGCTPTITFSGTGTRTLTLIATDPNGLQSEPDTVDVTVTACDGNCLPTAFLELGTDPSTTFGGAPLYFIEWVMSLDLTIAEADGPGDGPVDYTLGIRQVGSATVTAVDAGALPIVDASIPANTTITWTPEDDIAAWTNCSGIPRDYEFILQAEDASGGTSEAFILPVLLGCNFI